MSKSPVQDANDSNQYRAEDIEVLEGLEAVRRRPGMYVGDVRDGSGLHHLVWEVVANSVDQHLARRARHLRVDIDEGWVTVEDDGLGIPIDEIPGRGSVLDVVFTTLHCGATWDGHFPHVHLSETLRGVGVAVVNGLSARLEVESRRDGRLWRAVYERGRRVGPIVNAGRVSQSGTRVRFRPDPEIFSNPCLDSSAIEKRLREIAWLNPLLDVRWQGASLPGRGGLAAWVRELARGELECDEVLSTTRVIDEVWVDVAIGWRCRGEPELHAFVNQTRTPRGTHVQGLWRAFGDALEARVKPLRELLEPGMIACVHVGLLHPSFGSPTRDQLETPLARSSVRRALEPAIRNLIRWPSALGKLLGKRLAPVTPPAE